MYLRRISLTNFRIYRRLELTLPCGTIVVSGRNAQGKTSLLEAIYLLSTTRAPYSIPDRQLIGWNALDDVMPFSRVQGEVVRSGESVAIEVVNVLQAHDYGEESFSKRARIGGVPKRALDVIGTLNVVLFTPRDLDLVAGAPAERRRYLDVLLCQIDRQYCRALAGYNRLITQRNHLLRRLRDRGGDRNELAFWDERLAVEGAIIVARRHAAVADLAVHAAEIHGELADEETGRGLNLHYEASFSPAENSRAGGAVDPAGLGAAFAAALAARRDDDVARGITTFGPHRDDLSFSIAGFDMRLYGSRGQQRTITVAMKLAEARLMWTQTGERPVLLLDDVLSELDAKRRAHLLSHIDPTQQVIVTTTDADRLPTDFREGALVLHVRAGEIIRAESGGIEVTPPVAYDGENR